MATYTVTKDVTRPNTSTLWPEEHMAVDAGERIDGYVNLKSAGKLSVSVSVSSDGLSQTGIFVWASKTDYTQNLRGAGTRDSALAASSDAYFTYMAENNITARITEEDGTVRVFNSSNKTYEVE